MEQSLEEKINSIDWTQYHGAATTIVTGFNMANYLSAVFSNDDNKAEEYRLKINAESKDRYNKELHKFQSLLSENDFLIFKRIDDTYKRHVGFTNSILNYGEAYSYVWSIDSIQIDYLDYGKFGLMARFKAGRYHLFIWYCSDDGYDQGEYKIESDILPNSIFDHLETLKKQN